MQHGAIEAQPDRRLFQRAQPEPHRNRDRNQQIKPVGAQEIGQRDQRARQPRQRLMGVAEHRHDLRDDVGHQAGDDEYRHAGHDDRIDERQADLLAQCLAVLGVLGEAHQHRRQLSGSLAGFDQCPVQFREYRRVLRHRPRQSGAGQHFAAHAGEYLPLMLGFRLLDQRVERFLQRQPGAEHCRQLARDKRQLGYRQSAPDALQCLAGARLLADLIDLDRDQPLIAQAGAHLPRAVGFDHPLLQLAPRIEGLIFVAGHGFVRARRLGCQQRGS